MRLISLSVALACILPYVLYADGEKRCPTYVADQATASQATDEATPDISPEADMAQKVIRGVKRSLELVTRGCGCGKPRPKDVADKCGCNRPRPRPTKPAAKRPRVNRPRRSEEIDDADDSTEACNIDEDDADVCETCGGDILPEGVERCAECDGDICTIEDTNKACSSCGCKPCSCGCNTCSSSCCKAVDENKCGCNRPKPRPKCGCHKPKPRPKCGCHKPKPRPKCGDDVCTVDPAPQS